VSVPSQSISKQLIIGCLCAICASNE
jgi:hypothetical protein